MGSSRYVVYSPSFLALSFVRRLGSEYTKSEISIITLLSGVLLLVFSLYSNIQRLVFFVPATVLLGYVYGIVFTFSFFYVDFALGFHKFSESFDFLTWISNIFANFDLNSLL